MLNALQKERVAGGWLCTKMKLYAEFRTDIGDQRWHLE
jgi:hypothetical protein